MVKECAHECPKQTRKVLLIGTISKIVFKILVNTVKQYCEIKR